MKHGFTAYIDESGDEGFTFRPLPQRGSSQWLVLAAAVVPVDREMTELRAIDARLKEIAPTRPHAVHFCKLHHDQKVHICDGLGASDFRFVIVCFEKTRLTLQKFREEKHMLYFYVAKYLVERISWMCKDALTNPDQDQYVKLVFSNRSKMPYEALIDYFRLLHRQGNNAIFWPAINFDEITARAHEQLVGLKCADAVASGSRAAMELSHYGHCEDRYIRLLAPKFYHRNDRCLHFGLKFFPSTPAQDIERPARYKWISELFPK